MANNFNRTNTSTQIRNMYSDGMSYLNIKFYNTNLSFNFHAFTGKDQNGRSSYDTKTDTQTTVNTEGAFVLYQVSRDIIDGKLNLVDLMIPCAAGASLNFRREISPGGGYDTIFSISKDGRTIPFKFTTMIVNSFDANNQPVSKVIESGLGAFMKTIDGYLTGINADRHLDKLTDEYVKAVNGQGNNNNQSGQQNNNQNGYKNYNNNRKNYNNNGYNNNRGNFNPNWVNNNNQNHQNMSTYQIPNQ